MLCATFFQKMFVCILGYKTDYDYDAHMYVLIYHEHRETSAVDKCENSLLDSAHTLLYTVKVKHLSNNKQNPFLQFSTYANKHIFILKATVSRFLSIFLPEA